MSKSHAHRLITAAETVKVLPVDNIPDNERQARELGKLPQEKRAEAWPAKIPPWGTSPVQDSKPLRYQLVTP